MKLHAVAHLGRGLLTATESTVARPDGSTLTLSAPMYVLEQNMAAVLVFRVNELDQLVGDLDRWYLRDLQRDRSTGLTVSGSPDHDVVSRLAARYVREARDLSQHELSQWVQHVLAELSA